jgi:hypothetical protein
MMRAAPAGADEEAGMDGPFGDGGRLDRAVPRLSAAVVLLLAAGTLAGGAAPLVKAVALTVAVAVAGRSAQLILRRRRGAHRSRLTP